MSKFKHFNEFVKDKDKGKAPVKKIADYTGPMKNSPPGGGKPYAAAGKGGKAARGKVGSDWTDKGDKDLVYKPKTDQGMPDKGKAKCCDSVKEFVDATRDMTPADFAKYLAENAGNSGEVHESIEKTCHMLAEDPNMVFHFVAEANRSGIFSHLFRASFAYDEGFEILADMMGDGETGDSLCRKIARAVNEMVGPPMHHSGGGSLDVGDEEPDPGHEGMPPHHGKHPHPHDTDDEDLDLGDDDDDDGDEDGDGHEEDEFGLDDEDVDGMGDPSMGDDPDAPMSHDPHTNPTPHHRFRAPVGVGAEAPRPSMMSRMMAREGASPAARRLLKALRG